MIKTGLRYLQRVFLLFFTLLIAYFLTALVLSILSTNPKNDHCEQKDGFFIASNGIHLDIIIPREYLSDQFVQELNLEKHVDYVSFGWGDKEFYLNTPTWQDLKLSTAIKATFMEGESAIHLTKYRHQSGAWYTVSVCEYQIDLIIRYINNSFRRNSKGELLIIENAGYTVFDEFYEAKGNYNLINTCNNWVNRGLKKAEIQTAVWSPFDKGVLYHMEEDQ